MNDTDLTSLSNRAAELVNEAYHTGHRAGHDVGYQAGYAAALAAVLQAAQANAHTPTPLASSAPNITSPNVQPVAEISEAIPKTASGRAAPGSIKALVRAFVMTADKPVTENDFAARYPEVGRPSRYMAFRALDKDGAIQKSRVEHGFPRNPAQEDWASHAPR